VRRKVVWTEVLPSSTVSSGHICRQKHFKKYVVEQFLDIESAERLTEGCRCVCVIIILTSSLIKKGFSEKHH